MNGDMSGRGARWALPWRVSLPWVVALALFLGSTILFLELAEDVGLQEGFGWDVPLILAIRRYQTPLVTGVMLVVTELGAWLAVASALAVVVWLWQRDRRLDVLALVASLAGATLIQTVLKALFGRLRPDVLPPLVQAPGFSFPSGHTITAAALYGAIAVFLWPAGKRALAALSVLVVPLVALSRIYLGVHFPSDVLASMALAVMWLVVVLLWHHWASQRFGEAPHTLDGGPSTRR